MRENAGRSRHRAFHEADHSGIDMSRFMLTVQYSIDMLYP